MAVSAAPLEETTHHLNLAGDLLSRAATLLWDWLLACGGFLGLRRRLGRLLDRRLGSSICAGADNGIVLAVNAEKSAQVELSIGDVIRLTAEIQVAGEERILAAAGK